MSPAEKSTRLFDLVPEEVIESWIRGEYLLGSGRNAGYDFIGWCLLVRGFYEYTLYEETTPAPAGDNNGNGDGTGAPARKPYSRGFCIIDLEDGELTLKGLRTETFHPSDEGFLLPGFFRSEFSKMILPGDREAPAPGGRGAGPVVYFGYRSYVVEKQAPAGYEDVCLQKMRLTEQAAGSIGLADADPGRSDGRRRLAVYDYLTDARKGFDHHLREVEKAFEAYDAKRGHDARRNLFAVIQLLPRVGPERPAGRVRDSFRIDARYDAIPGCPNGPARGHLVFDRVDMLGHVESVRTGTGTGAGVGTGTGAGGAVT